jgi:Sulfotransferase family
VNVEYSSAVVGTARPREIPAADLGAGPPIFIGGMPRSGTTLLAQLLGSHEEIAIPPTELGFLRVATFGPDFDPRRPIRSRQELIDHLRHLSAGPIAEWGLDEDRLIASTDSVELSFRGLFVYVLESFRRSAGKPRVGEKTPLYERHLDVLQEWFPDYRYVQLIRNPIDTLSSAWWRWNDGRPSGWDVLSWIHEWNRSTTIALRRAYADPARHLTVRYEDLVARTEAELARVCAFVDVDPARIAHTAERHDNSTFAAQARSRVYAGPVRTRDDVDRRGLMRPRDLEAVVSLCGPLAHVAGYDIGLPPSRHGALGRLPYGRVPLRLAAPFTLRRLRALIRP